MNKLDNPCHKCVCIPICRHKHFNRLVDDCILVDEYIMHNIIYMKHTNYVYTKSVMDVLNPTRWEVGSNHLIKELDL